MGRDFERYVFGLVVVLAVAGESLVSRYVPQHGLDRRLGASYDVPQGYTSCITLAPTLTVVGDQVPKDRWAMLADALGGDPPERVAALVEELELPNRLRDVGVPEGELETIAEEFGDRADDAREILRRAR